MSVHSRLCPTNFSEAISAKLSIPHFAPTCDSIVVRSNISLLRDEGWSETEVVGDGNCLFRSVSKFLYGRQDFHLNIRHSVVSYMAQFSALFAPHVEQDFNIYLQQMSMADGRRTSWGSQVEILAIATMLRCPVYIFCLYGSNMTWTIWKPLFVQGEPLLPYITLRHGNDHYTAICPTQGCICQKPSPTLNQSITYVDLTETNLRPKLDLVEWPSLTTDDEGFQVVTPRKKRRVCATDIGTKIELLCTTKKHPASNQVDTLPEGMHYVETNISHEVEIETSYLDTNEWPPLPSTGSSSVYMKQPKQSRKGPNVKSQKDQICSQPNPSNAQSDDKECSLDNTTETKPKLGSDKKENVTSNIDQSCSEFNSRKKLSDEKEQPDEITKVGKPKQNRKRRVNNVNSSMNKTSNEKKTKEARLHYQTQYNQIVDKNTSDTQQNNIHCQESDISQSVQAFIPDHKDHPYFSHSSRGKKTRKSLFKSSANFIKESPVAPDIECFSCKKLFYPSDSLNTVDLNTSQEITNTLKPLMDNDNVAVLCNPCFKDLTQAKVPAQCKLNNMDPSPIPDCLASLNSMEQRLIAQVHAYMKLVLLPYGQSALNGQVINFPFSLSQMLAKESVNSDIVIVQALSNSEVPKEFKADLAKVKSAILWLQSNNTLYENFDLDVLLEKVPEVITLNEKQQETDSMEDLTESSITSDVNPMPKINFEEKVTQKKTVYSEITKIVLPKNTNKPLNTYKELCLEELAFPHLFPIGKHGLLYPRATPITHLKYFQARLLSSDRRFSSHLPYLFWATNITEKQKLSENISVAYRRQSFTTNKRSKTLDVGAVRAQVGANPDLPENYYGYMRNIRGSPSYWISAKLDLLSMIRTHGAPTFFLTLSANDMNWNDLMIVLCKSENLPCSIEDIELYPKQFKTKLMNRNPILTARHFSRRFNSFVDNVMLSSHKPLGTITQYFWRVEFQARGSPHIHSLWWVEGAPDMETEEGRAAAPDFIDTYISAKIPSVEEDPLLNHQVSTLQHHKHTDTCKRLLHGEEKCRFDFPQPISETTKIKSVKDILTSSKCYIIEREKGCEFINPYNPILLQQWNANMDIQFIGSVHGAAKYVCSYICKREADNLRSALSDIERRIPRDATFHSKFMTIGNTFFTHRQLSAQEAAYKMCSLPLRGSTSTVIYLDIKPEMKRNRLLLPSSTLRNLSDDSTDIFVKNIFDRYTNRPAVAEFEDMNLHTFVSQYQTSSVSSRNAVPLLNSMGYLHKKRKAAVVRTTVLSPEKDGETFYLSQLILYVPWRKEKDLISEFDSAKDAYDAKIEKKQRFENQLEKAINQIQSYNVVVVNDYIAPIVAPNVECCDNDLPPVKEMPEDFLLYETEYQDDPISDIKCDEEKILDGIYFEQEEQKELNVIKSTRMTDCEFEATVNGLNFEQKGAFDHVNRYFAQLNDFNQGLVKDKPSSFCLFICGLGGTGKSHLISLLQESMRRFTNNPTPVIITAPTGVAAFNISGITFHRALSLPIEHGRKIQYMPLAGGKLHILRMLWRNVTTIVIDEISMVSYQTLEFIHLRLNKIFGIDDFQTYFGGLNVIATGDFYQLPPVSGLPVFSDKANTSFGKHLWRDFFSFIELKTVVRQQDDILYRELLKNVRSGTPTESDVNTLLKHVHRTYNCQTDTEEIYLFPTVVQCRNHNKDMLTKLQEKQTLYTFCDNRPPSGWLRGAKPLGPVLGPLTSFPSV